MKLKLMRLIISLLVFSQLFINLSIVQASSDNLDNKESLTSNKEIRKIVVFNDEDKNLKEEEKIAKFEAKADKFEAKYKDKLIKVKKLSIINAIVVKTNESNLKTLKNDKDVLRIDNDDILSIASQVTPINIQQIEAHKLLNNPKIVYTTPKIKVATIDTGIDYFHPDLNSISFEGTNTIVDGGSYYDDHGHGTNLAGIIAGINNTVGIVGTCQNVALYTCKALDSNGNGYLSDIVQGIQWAISRNVQIINMSFSQYRDNSSLEAAIIRAYNAGVMVVAAAGNDGTSVSYPAAYNNVIAVSSVDSNNVIAYNSGRGSQIDICAPGVSIYTTDKNSSYCYASGTSMAAPHVTAILSIIYSFPSLADYNKNGILERYEVLNRLYNNSTTNLGSPELYGFGIVNSRKSVQELLN